MAEQSVHDARIAAAKDELWDMIVGTGGMSMQRADLMIEKIKQYGYLCWDKGYDDGLEDGMK